VGSGAFSFPRRHNYEGGCERRVQDGGHTGTILESPRCALVTVELVGALRKEALSEWGDWLANGWDWSWFVTMTFDPKRVQAGTRTQWGWGATSRAWDQFVEHVTPEARDSQGLSGSVWWVRGREPHHDSGGTHFHGLIGGLDSGVRRDEANRWLWERYGMNRVDPYDPARGAAHYLTKYVVKELGDIQFSRNLGLYRRTSHGR
jgi:hypothetical protein